MEFPPKPPLNTGHSFCEMELEHTERFPGLSGHFFAMSTVALRVAIAGVNSLTPHATKNA
jgi:hypothetical protein